MWKTPQPLTLILKTGRRRTSSAPRELPTVARDRVPIRYPAPRVGNYMAPVDTTGMDPEMMKTMGIKRMRQPGDTTGVAAEKAAARKPKPWWHPFIKSIMGG